jgi:hypothetical protein
MSLTTTIDGSFRGRPVRLVIEDGKITQGQHESAASWAIGTVEGGGEVSIPGVWAGPASLTDPWAIRALFLKGMDPDGLTITQTPPAPSLTEPEAMADTVY